MNYKKGNVYSEESVYKRHKLYQNKKKSRRKIIISTLLVLIVICVGIGAFYIITNMNRYHINDLVIQDIIMTRNDMKPFNGIIYDDNGKWGKYVNGKPEGTIKKFDINGNISSETNYKNGLKNGSKREWCSNGQLQFQAFYVKGKRNGLSQSWFCNGNAKDSVKFISGKKEGIEKTWYDNNVLSKKITYIDNEIVEEWRWNENGRLMLVPYDENAVREYLKGIDEEKHPIEGIYEYLPYTLAIIKIDEHDDLIIINLRETINAGEGSEWFSIGEVKGWIDPRISTLNTLNCNWVNADKSIVNHLVRFYPSSGNLYVVRDDKNTSNTRDDINFILKPINSN